MSRWWHPKTFLYLEFVLWKWWTWKWLLLILTAYSAGCWSARLKLTTQRPQFAHCGPDGPKIIEQTGNRTLTDRLSRGLAILNYWMWVCQNTEVNYWITELLESLAFQIQGMAWRGCGRWRVWEQSRKKEPECWGLLASDWLRTKPAFPTPLSWHKNLLQLRKTATAGESSKHG